MALCFAENYQLAEQLLHSIVVETIIERQLRITDLDLFTRYTILLSVE